MTLKAIADTTEAAEEEFNYFRVVIRRRIEEVRTFYVETNVRGSIPDVEHYVEDAFTMSTPVDFDNAKHSMSLKSIEEVTAIIVDEDDDNCVYKLGEDIVE